MRDLSKSPSTVMPIQSVRQALQPDPKDSVSPPLLYKLSNQRSHSVLFKGATANNFFLLDISECDCCSCCRAELNSGYSEWT